ncbi:MAG TPA: NAD-dependent epimerase/dehydratase family protein [Pirellulales bacterium]|nr:NAD-dependent epimerase/dehydratase family protein [Pirellulales bacterium]
MDATLNTMVESRQHSKGSKVVGITGTRGFLAKALLGSSRSSKNRVITLARRPSETAAPSVESRCLDLSNETVEPDLAGIDTLVHVAAETGKASRTRFDAINNLATRRLLIAAREAGVSKVIYISSIAVRSPLSHLYPYARSKQAAEQAVRDSQIPYIILRPTMVLGPGSPIGTALERLTRLPVLPLFGGALAKVQPIDVQDLAEYIWMLVEGSGGESSKGSIVEIGGAEIVTMRALMMRFCERARGRCKPSVVVPVRWMLWPLYFAEPLLLPLLPVTAGQLTGFICDGCCDPQLKDVSFIPSHDLPSMIERTISLR